MCTVLNKYVLEFRIVFIFDYHYQKMILYYDCHRNVLF